MTHLCRQPCVMAILRGLCHNLVSAGPKVALLSHWKRILGSLTQAYNQAGLVKQTLDQKGFEVRFKPEPKLTKGQVHVDWDPVHLGQRGPHYLSPVCLPPTAERFSKTQLTLFRYKCSITSFLLLAVLNDAWCIHKSDPLQKFVGNLDAN